MQKYGINPVTKVHVNALRVIEQSRPRPWTFLSGVHVRLMGSLPCLPLYVPLPFLKPSVTLTLEQTSCLSYGLKNLQMSTIHVRKPPSAQELAARKQSRAYYH